MYEMGETSFLDMLFNSANMIDFISNYYTMSQFVQYDTELLETIENDKKQIWNTTNGLKRRIYRFKNRPKDN